MPGYVLVTAAHDEAEVIGDTIDAVAAQTVTPLAWAIVSDGSTDGTDEVVRDRAAALPWIVPLRVDRTGGPSFVGKARAVALGWQAVQDRPAFAVGNLDADVVPPPAYYERCIAALEQDESLGITGGVIVEGAGARRRRQRSSRRSVAGGVQVFRRTCWELAGGYLPLEGGGEDAVAEVIVRSHGWSVQAAGELEVVHHGRVLSGSRSVLQARWRRGRTCWRLGYHPAFLLASAASRVTEAPVVIGSLATLAGYGSAAVRQLPRTPPPALVAELRADQLHRLGRLATGWR